MKKLWFSLAVVLSAFAVWGGCGITKHVIIAIDRWGEAGQSTQKTLSDLTRPCSPIKGKLLTVDNAKNCGLLPQFAITLNTVRGTMGQVEVALEKENRASDDLHNTQVAMAGAITKLGNAGEEFGGTAKKVGTLTDSINQTVLDLNNKETGIPATVANVNDGVTELREYLKSKEMQQIASDIQSTLHNTAGMTESGNAILADGRKVVDKETADFLKPVPMWKKPFKRAGEFIDIGSAVARNIP